MVKKYPNPVVVFDGYSNGPSIKDQTHVRRSKGLKSVNVIVLDGRVLKSKMETFLANEYNKMNFISLLMETLKFNSIPVKQATGDADLLIVQTAIQLSSSEQFGATQVIGEDTDLLVLLCHHSDLPKGKLIMKSDKRTIKREEWDIGGIRSILGTEVCHLLPFIHSLGGCDTTSRLFGIGKSVCLRKARQSVEFREIGTAFTSPSSTADQITAAGEKVLVLLYGGKHDTSLNQLRVVRWAEKVVTGSASVQVKSLPPTSDGARYHSLRVYLQTQIWMDNQTLKPEEWGWKLSPEKQKYTPRKMDLPPAPKALLKVIRCECKTDCTSKRCSCKKHGLECSNTCSGCRGISCENSANLIEDLDEADDSLFD